MQRVGVISDTHGLLRPEAVERLRGSDLIVHAGDVGPREILDRLRELAPVRAVRGNVDIDPWTEELPLTQEFTVEQVRVALHHGHLPTPPAFGRHADLVVQGHSHRPVLERVDGVLRLNPGSAGRRRFNLPICLALVSIDGEQVDAELIYLTS